MFDPYLLTAGFKSPAYLSCFSVDGLGAVCAHFETMDEPFFFYHQDVRHIINELIEVLQCIKIDYPFAIILQRKNPFLEERVHYVIAISDIGAYLEIPLGFILFLSVHVLGLIFLGYPARFQGRSSSKFELKSVAFQGF